MAEDHIKQLNEFGDELRKECVSWFASANLFPCLIKLPFPAEHETSLKSLLFHSIFRNDSFVYSHGNPIPDPIEPDKMDVVSQEYPEEDDVKPTSGGWVRPSGSAEQKKFEDTARRTQSSKKPSAAAGEPQTRSRAKQLKSDSGTDFVRLPAEYCKLFKPSPKSDGSGTFPLNHPLVMPWDETYDRIYRTIKDLWDAEIEGVVLFIVRPIDGRIIAGAVLEYLAYPSEESYLQAVFGPRELSQITCPSRASSRECGLSPSEAFYLNLILLVCLFGFREQCAKDPNASPLTSRILVWHKDTCHMPKVVWRILTEFILASQHLEPHNTNRTPLGKPHTDSPAIIPDVEERLDREDEVPLDGEDSEMSTTVMHNWTEVIGGRSRRLTRKGSLPNSSSSSSSSSSAIGNLHRLCRRRSTGASHERDISGSRQMGTKYPPHLKLHGILKRTPRVAERKTSRAAKSGGRGGGGGCSQIGSDVAASVVGMIQFPDVVSPVPIEGRYSECCKRYSKFARQKWTTYHREPGSRVSFVERFLLFSLPRLHAVFGSRAKNESLASVRCQEVPSPESQSETSPRKDKADLRQIHDGSVGSTGQKTSSLLPPPDSHFAAWIKDLEIPPACAIDWDVDVE